MAEAEREKRIIRHALFTYDLTEEGGAQGVALRGEEVELLPHDIERGEKFDAFVKSRDELTPGARTSVAAYPAAGSTVEQDAWVDSVTVQEALDAVNADQSIAASVRAAEERRGDNARKTLLEALARIEASG